METAVIRDFERKNVIICSLILFLLWNGLSLGTILSQASVVYLGMENVPYIFIFSAFVSSLGSIFYVKFSKKIDVRTFLFLFILLISLILFLARLAIIGVSTEQKLNWNIGLYFLVVLACLALTGSIMLPMIWNVINQIFRPIQLQRLRHIFSLSAIITGITSGFISNFTVKFFSIAELSTVWVILLLASASLVYKFYIKSPQNLSISYKETHDNKNLLYILKEEITLYKENKIAVIILAASFLIGITHQTNIFQFIYVANETIKNPKETAYFFSTFQLVIFSFILLFLLFFRNKFTSYFGSIRSIMWHPIVTTIGFSLILLYFGLYEIAILRGFCMFLHNIAIIPGFQIAYQVLPPKYRENLIVISSTLRDAGFGFAGLLWLVATSQHQTIITLTCLIISVICVLFLWKGKKIYAYTLLNNLKNKTQRFDSLENLEEAYNKDVNAELLKILLDEKDLYETSEKVKVIQTMKRLENTYFLRPLSLVLNHHDFEIRQSAIEAIIHLFKPVANEVFISDYFKEKMENIIKTEKVDSIRYLATQFLFEYTSKENVTRIFNELIVKSEDENLKLITFRTLRFLTSKFSDFLELKGLEDHRPAIQGEIATGLWRYEAYRLLSNKIIEGLLNSHDTYAQAAGLKAIALTDINARNEKEIVHFIASPDVEVQSFAYLILIMKTDISIPKETLIKNWIQTACNPNFNEDKWKKFISLLVDIENYDLIDIYLHALQQIAPTHPEIVQHIRILAHIMYERLEVPPL